MDKNENKEIEVATEQINESLAAIDGYVQTVIGITREFYPFKAHIGDDLSVSIVAESGWCLVLPSMTPVWILVMDWLSRWDEESRGLMEMYIKGIAFPTTTRLSDIDEQYVNDILNAHDSLTKRNIQKNKYDDYDE